MDSVHTCIRMYGGTAQCKWTMHAGTYAAWPPPPLRLPQSPAASPSGSQPHAPALCEHGMCISRPSGGGLRGRGVDQHPELHPELHPGWQFTRAPDSPPAESEGARTEVAAAPAEAASAPSAAQPAAAKVKAAKPPDLGAWKEIKALLSALPRLAATAPSPHVYVYHRQVTGTKRSLPLAAHCTRGPRAHFVVLMRVDQHWLAQLDPISLFYSCDVLRSRWVAFSNSQLQIQYNREMIQTACNTVQIHMHGFCVSYRSLHGCIPLHAPCYHAVCCAEDPSRVVVVSTAPSVRVTVPEALGLPRDAARQNWEAEMYTALRRLGFAVVFDTNFAADLTIMEEGTELLHRCASRAERAADAVAQGRSDADVSSRMHAPSSWARTRLPSGPAA